MGIQEDCSTWNMNFLLKGWFLCVPRGTMAVELLLLGVYRLKNHNFLPLNGEEYLFLGE
jgi:hypothetical protein